MLQINGIRHGISGVCYTIKIHLEKNHRGIPLHSQWQNAHYVGYRFLSTVLCFHSIKVNISNELLTMEWWDRSCTIPYCKLRQVAHALLAVLVDEFILMQSRLTGITIIYAECRIYS